MFDMEAIDRLYEATPEKGAMRFALFDKRVLLPLGQLAQAVRNETGEAITTEELVARAAEGWFEPLDGAGEGGADKGAPLYVPSRIGLFLKLEREGYSADELGLMAKLEELTVDESLTAEELAYVDDDLETLVLQARARVEAGKAGLEVREDTQNARAVQKVDGELRLLRGLQENGIPDHLRPVIEKHAFRAKAFNDLMRNWLVDRDRAKVRCGYSSFVLTRRETWGPNGFTAADINWSTTLKIALAYAETREDLPVRVPGFVLRAERVIPTRTMRAGEYASLWKEHDFDTYLKTWSDLSGERRCLNCFSPLAADANERQRFCGDKCRNAARQRRLRERNPLAVERAQKRYWDSIELDNEKAPR